MKKNSRVFDAFYFFVLPPLFIFIAEIIKLKFFTPEKHWFLLSLVYAITFLVGTLLAFEIAHSVKTTWFVILIALGIILIMSIILKIIDTLFYALINCKITEICDDILLFFYNSFMFNIVIALLQLMNKETEKTD